MLPGEWVAARSAAGVAVGVFDRGAGDARLADLARCLGACADAHLGHWESALHAVASSRATRKRHAEIAPWCLAIRVAALVAVGDPKTALLTWREATSKAPFAGLKLDAYQFEEHDASRATDAECGARDMPAYVACRAFAAQAAWGAGERREATRLAEQTAGLMKMMRARRTRSCPRRRSRRGRRSRGRARWTRWTGGGGRGRSRSATRSSETERRGCCPSPPSSRKNCRRCCEDESIRIYHIVREVLYGICIYIYFGMVGGES